MISYEQRLKNYLDKRYGWYDNTQEAFYYQNVNHERDNRDFAEKLGPLEDKRKAIMEKRVKAKLEGPSSTKWINIFEAVYYLFIFNKNERKFLIIVSWESSTNQWREFVASLSIT